MHFVSLINDSAELMIAMDYVCVSKVFRLYLGNPRWSHSLPFV